MAAGSIVAAGVYGGAVFPCCWCTTLASRRSARHVRQGGHNGYGYQPAPPQRLRNAGGSTVRGPSHQGPRHCRRHGSSPLRWFCNRMARRWPGTNGTLKTPSWINYSAFSTTACRCGKSPRNGKIQIRHPTAEGQAVRCPAVPVPKRRDSGTLGRCWDSQWDTTGTPFFFLESPKGRAASVRDTLRDRRRDSAFHLSHWPVRCGTDSGLFGNPQFRPGYEGCRRSWMAELVGSKPCFRFAQTLALRGLSSRGSHGRKIKRQKK